MPEAKWARSDHALEIIQPSPVKYMATLYYLLAGLSFRMGGLYCVRRTVILKNETELCRILRNEIDTPRYINARQEMARTVDERCSCPLAMYCGTLCPHPALSHRERERVRGV
jgi:hypothetical protein